MNDVSYLDSRGIVYKYGEFFPPEFSRFPYNKSNAMRFFPKNEKQAISEGYFWDKTEATFYSTTLKSSDLPDNIKETNELILNEIIECDFCSRAYKIVKGELDLLRKLNLPVPHECPKCRENKRFERMTMPRLFNRSCDKCGIKLRSPYSPERPEIIYCEKCYQQEVF